MKEIYLKEAIEQMAKLETRVISVKNLMNKAIEKQKMWCSHCQLDVWAEDYKCPRCGTGIEKEE